MDIVWEAGQLLAGIGLLAWAYNTGRWRQRTEGRIENLESVVADGGEEKSE